MTEIYLGYPPEHIRTWIELHKKTTEVTPVWGEGVWTVTYFDDYSKQNIMQKTTSYTEASDSYKYYSMSRSVGSSGQDIGTYMNILYNAGAYVIDVPMTTSILIDPTKATQTFSNNIICNNSGNKVRITTGLTLKWYASEADIPAAPANPVVHTDGKWTTDPNNMTDLNTYTLAMSGTQTVCWQNLNIGEYGSYLYYYTGNDSNNPYTWSIDTNTLPGNGSENELSFGDGTHLYWVAD